jgi:IclR family acetate operon transcriptional repressor
VSSVQSIHRAFRILEALAVSPAGVSDMARRVDLPKSTVARILATLEEEGAVERRPDGLSYRIGPALRGLAASIDGSIGLVDLVRPSLARLAGLTSETAGFAVVEGNHVHYLAQVDSDRNVQVRDWTGELIPMHLVPSGLVMLAQRSTPEIEQYISWVGESPAPGSLVEPDRLIARLREVRKLGHVWVRGEFDESINSVGAAVTDAAGQVLGAMHIHGPAYRFPAPGDDQRVADLVMDAAGRLAAAEARLAR